MHEPKRVRPSHVTIAVLTAALGLAAAVPASAEPAYAAAPSDTGLFAPVAAQWAARVAAAKDRPGRPDAAFVLRLLDAGRQDDAVRELASLDAKSRAVAVAGARVRLARSEFEAAKPYVDRVLDLRDPTDDERALRYDWLFAIDASESVDRLTRGLDLEPRTRAPIPDLLAAGRLAYDMLDYARAESCYARVHERLADGTTPAERAFDAGALVGLGDVAYKRRDYDAALERHREAVTRHATADGLLNLCTTLIRVGRTDEGITAAEWAVRLHPRHVLGHYYLGNGYARKNYTQLAAAFPDAFADAAGGTALAAADRLLAEGDRAGARTAYEAVRAAHPGWADAAVRLASLDFEDGRFDEARDGCLEALASCPEYGRAHATLSKVLEAQAFAVDVHRAGYERRFEQASMPDVPGIESFVLNWKALSPRHQKRIALSIAPWKQYLPVLVAGGATYYIKPLYMLLSETPGLEVLRDTRIGYDSRLWDDVRGAGGYNTVTGIEDVERTIFDRYNTVLHELTHQVHAVMTPDQAREIQTLYAAAKVRDEPSGEGFMSRYAAGSVYEYFAEGANALYSPKRDAWDTREVVRERLDRMDPELRTLIERFMADSDVSASYPVAFTNAGDDRLARGDVDDALPWYEKALDRDPSAESALEARTRAYTYGNRGAEALAAADRALEARGESGAVVVIAATARWHGGRGLDAALETLASARPGVRAEDRYLVDVAIGRLAWSAGDAARAVAACDSVLAYQSDHPEGLWARAAALALAGRTDEAFETYARVVRMRTGLINLRCDYARDLLRAGRVDEARAQLAEAALLDEHHPTAEALRGWADLVAGDLDGARGHLDRALEWGEWCDLARIVRARVERAAGNAEAARAAAAPVRDRIARVAAPGYVFREERATWEPVHRLPAVERLLLDEPAGGRAKGAGR